MGNALLCIGIFFLGVFSGTMVMCLCFVSKNREDELVW